MSARNGKVDGIYFLIVMLAVYGTVWSREGSIFSWLWLSPARATHLTGHMGASHQHMGLVVHTVHKTELEQSWSWLVVVVVVAHTVTVGGVGASPGIRKATCFRRRRLPTC